MSLKQKLYEDYIKQSRLPEYRKTIQIAKAHGYEMVGVLDFARIVRSENLKGRRIYLNRHDIDTSPAVAKKMFEIEKEIYGREGSATYYFRDTTQNIKLIKEIDDYGYETGYHYEELATYIKKHKLRNRKEIEKHIKDAGAIFLEDLKRFRIETGSKSVTVASHGDFINTRYNIQNYEMLKIPEIRQKADIEAEAYDEDIMKYVQERMADQHLLAGYAAATGSIFEKEIPIVMTLTHPRNWQVDFRENTKENWRRLSQDIRFRF